MPITLQGPNNGRMSSSNGPRTKLGYDNLIRVRPRSPHQLDFAPYTSRSYSAQWNVPELLHDMHMLHLSHIFRKMEVEEPWQGLRLPWHYQVDMGAS